MTIELSLDKYAEKAKSTVAIVTGGNSGIGFEAVSQLAEAGTSRVFMVTRSTERGQAALNAVPEAVRERVVLIDGVDMALKQSVVMCVDRFVAYCEEKSVEYDTLVLINNAATFDLKQSASMKTSEGFDSFLACNYLNVWYMTSLLSKIKGDREMRVLNISSLGLLAHFRLDMSLDDLDGTRHGWTPERTYYLTKMYLHLMTKKLAESDDGILPLNIMVTNVRFSEDRLIQLGYGSCFRCIYSLKSRFAISPREMAFSYVHYSLCPKSQFPLVAGGACVNKNCQVIEEPRCVRRTVERNGNIVNELWQMTEKMLHKNEAEAETSV